MKVADITVDLDLAEELQENGFEQEGLFKWLRNYGNTRRRVASPQNVIRGEVLICSAPTTDELFKDLPEKRKYHERIYILKISKYGVSYVNNRYPAFINMTLNKYKKLPNALAKMWLYLKKEKLI